MTKSDAAEFVLEGIRKGGFEAYLVGGCVRDLLLKREPKDYDVTTDARPEEVMELFPKTIPVGAAFGVITVMVEDVPIEVATYRSDGKYADGRHPDIVFYADRASDDVSRRDFTINGLLMSTLEKRPSGEYVIRPTPPPGVEETVAMTKDGLYTVTDYVGGLEDLQEEVIRAIGNPEERFKEDALRMLRACRFAAQLGFTIEANTLIAIQKLAPTIVKVSAERISTELIKIVSSPYPVNGLVPLAVTGLLDYLPIKPVKRGFADVLRRFSAFPTDDSILGMAMLLTASDHMENTPRYLLGEKMRLSNGFRDIVSGALTARAELLVNGYHLPMTKLAHRKRFMRKVGVSTALKLYEQDIILGSGFIATFNGISSLSEGMTSVADAQRLIADLRALTPEEINPKRLVTGDDLIALGLEPGREFREILEEIETRQLEGEYTDRLVARTFAEAAVNTVRALKAQAAG